PVFIEQRTARIAGIDGGIRLNCRIYRTASRRAGHWPRADGTLKARDHAGRKSSIETKRITDCEHLLADQKLVRIAKRHHGQSTRGRIDLNYRKVRVRIAA